MYINTSPTHVCTSKYICTYTLIQTCLHVLRQTPPHTHKYTYLFEHAHLHPNTHIHVSLYMCTYNYTLPIIRLHKKGKLSCHMLCPTFCHSTKLLNHMSQNTSDLHL